MLFVYMSWWWLESFSFPASWDVSAARAREVAANVQGPWCPSRPSNKYLRDQTTGGTIVIKFRSRWVEGRDTVLHGRCYRPVLNDFSRVGLKGTHLSPSQIWCIGEIVRKQRARLEIMGSNPRDRARAFTREKLAWLATIHVCGSLEGSSIFSFIFWAQKHLVPGRVTDRWHFDRY